MVFCIPSNHLVSVRLHTHSGWASGAPVVGAMPSTSSLPGLLATALRLTREAERRRFVHLPEAMPAGTTELAPQVRQHINRSSGSPQESDTLFIQYTGCACRERVKEACQKENFANRTIRSASKTVEAEREPLSSFSGHTFCLGHPAAHVAGDVSPFPPLIRQCSSPS